MSRATMLLAGSTGRVLLVVRVGGVAACRNGCFWGWEGGRGGERYCCGCINCLSVPRCLGQQQTMLSGGGGGAREVGEGWWQQSDLFLSTGYEGRIQRPTPIEITRTDLIGEPPLVFFCLRVRQEGYRAVGLPTCVICNWTCQVGNMALIDTKTRKALDDSLQGWRWLPASITQSLCQCGIH